MIPILFVLGWLFSGIILFLIVNWVEYHLTGEVSIEVWQIIFILVGPFLSIIVVAYIFSECKDKVIFYKKKDKTNKV